MQASKFQVGAKQKPVFGRVMTPGLPANEATEIRPIPSQKKRPDPIDQWTGHANPKTGKQMREESGRSMPQCPAFWLFGTKALYLMHVQMNWTFGSLEFFLGLGLPSWHINQWDSG